MTGTQRECSVDPASCILQQFGDLDNEESRASKDAFSSKSAVRQFGAPALRKMSGVATIDLLLESIVAP
jgi:hypothetical protein